MNTGTKREKWRLSPDEINRAVENGVSALVANSRYESGALK